MNITSRFSAVRITLTANAVKTATATYYITRQGSNYNNCSVVLESKVSAF